jgi:sterol desaturase/sphingolipid hydroxylase (fatty acid hydroxylase superfamily)
MENIKLISRKKAGLKDLIQCFSVFTPVFLILLLIAYYLQEDKWLFYFMLFFTGWLTWTFVEYMVHRFWMHHPYKKFNNSTYKIHMNHHKHPTDIRITNAQRYGCLFGSLILIIWSLWLNNYFTLAVGFYNGFLWYSYMHVFLHQKWAGKIFPKLQEFHIHHHGKYPNTGYSFSIIWWDKIFKTMPPADAKISDRVREFYFTGHHHN